MSLRLANDIRAYVAAVSARNAEVADPVSDADMTAWSLWALAQADRVDPVLARVFLQPVSEEDAEEDGSESTQPGNGCASTITTPALPTSAWHPNRWYTRLRRRSEEHTSELQSLMRISYAVFCLK